MGSIGSSIVVAEAAVAVGFVVVDCSWAELVVGFGGVGIIFVLVPGGPNGR